MCYLEDVYYTLCGHWGEKFNYRPCGAACAPKGATYGCSNSQTTGPKQVKTLCKDCSRRQQRNGRATSAFSAGPVTNLQGRQPRRIPAYEAQFPTFRTQFLNFGRIRSVFENTEGDEERLIPADHGDHSGVDEHQHTSF